MSEVSPPAMLGGGESQHLPEARLPRQPPTEGSAGWISGVRANRIAPAHIPFVSSVLTGAWTHGCSAVPWKSRSFANSGGLADGLLNRVKPYLVLPDLRAHSTLAVVLPARPNDLFVSGTADAEKICRFRDSGRRPFGNTVQDPGNGAQLRSGRSCC